MRTTITNTGEWPNASLEPLFGRVLPGNGQRLYSVESGSGRPVVFIHGLGWTHALWRKQIERHSGRYRTIAADNRGHGGSDKPTSPYSIRDMAKDWLGLLNALGAKEWCLIGFSQGGMIAQWIAALEPARTKALVLMATSCRTDPSTRDAMEARIAAARESPRQAAEIAAATIFSAAFMSRERTFIEHFVVQRAKVDQQALAAATRALNGFDIRDELPKIACPTLVIAAAGDRLIPAAASEEMTSLIKGARMERIANSGHMALIEQPDRVDELIDAFLLAKYPQGQL